MGVHELAITVVHVVRENRVECAAAKLISRSSDYHVAAGLEKTAVEVERHRLVLVWKMLDESDAHDNIELATVAEVADVGNLVLDPHLVAVPDALVARGRIHAQKRIGLRKKTEPVRLAEFIVIHEHRLTAGIERVQLHCLVSFRCAQEKDSWTLVVEP